MHDVKRNTVSKHVLKESSEVIRIELQMVSFKERTERGGRERDWDEFSQTAYACVNDSRQFKKGDLVHLKITSQAFLQ